MTLSLARRARRFPDRTAVVDVSEERLSAPAKTVHEDRVSYSELSDLATDAAKRLSALAVDAGDTVSLVTRNRVVSLALLFACRRLDATFAPISHRLTPETVERPFDAISPDIVVFEAAQRDLVRSIPHGRSITLEKLATVDPVGAARVDSGDTDRPLLVLHGDDGRPAVAFSERALEWNCISALVTWGLSADDVVPVVTPLSEPDGLVRVALSVVYAGGRLLLDRAFDPGDTITAIEAEDATFLSGRTVAFRDLAADPAFDAAADSLERAVADGSVPDALLAPYRERDVTVTRAYGRLECPTALCESAETVHPNRDDTVGVPIPDCRVRLIDDDGAVFEEAGTGRLLLSGPVVADGYVNAAASDDAAADDRFGGGRFLDGWFDTGERFRRDERGVYHIETS
ncbi:long-chain fatty acid--CoA ligase [Natrarchaeobius halalkaliphilus]|uniref:Long-chain fatty acid--CoA ligase n=1 Tax=Natrarchaeobius halalkaliphilus TaxID=1679091 RepID=A0A3N6N4S2_9EURY|nr:AMP-binding protein [Natrarchaeobius halalkaliphilus]RQG93192.1 long-chain fatty acid--CoA ligase [Natrarchaeobius halalkaliphilus]